MPLIRTRADIDEHLGGPTPAEDKLLATCLAGDFCVLSGELPPKRAPDPAIQIRADVLRYLITGGCDLHPVADWGVTLAGAHITGSLDLNLASSHGVTGLIRCRFDNPIDALQAKLQILNLNSSAVPALNAQGAKVTGSVLLRGITAEATVAINSATIDGQLSCEDARFNATSGHALNAHSMQVKGSVFLRGITAEATVAINSATIDGQLDCDDAGFNATSGHALNAQGAKVRQAFFFRRVSTANGVINLTTAQVGTLVDDPESWPSKERLILDGFIYSTVENATFLKLTHRLDWLAKGSTWVTSSTPSPTRSWPRSTARWDTEKMRAPSCLISNGSVVSIAESSAASNQTAT
ncbi:hypothetical protein [uncultured Roseobacter sp.]|uniref:hypothetical protein n=1 Tax=uncultured Roseobacter sp. TaxID=114847 RepID=UPI00263577ED|nr:hypothetical protein [uncultured Roseobacter sp.]